MKILSTTVRIMLTLCQLVQRLREELSSTDDLTRHLRDELESVTNRLAAGIEENDQLYRRLRDLEARGQATPPHPRSRSVDSLSDLTNIQLDLDLAQLDKDRFVICNVCSLAFAL